MSLPEPFDWKNYNRRTGEGDPSTPMTAEKLNDWWARVRAFVTGYTDPLVAPADGAVAGFVDNPASSTRASLDTVVGAAIDDLRVQVPTLEDLFVTSTVFAGGTTVPTAESSRPIFSAPFPLTVTSVTLMSWAGATIATSETNYWGVIIRKRQTGTGTVSDVTHKSTKTTASSPYPAGEAWVPREPWTFNASAFTNATLGAGDALYVGMFPFGTAPTLSAPIVATVGYRPL